MKAILLILGLGMACTTSAQMTKNFIDQPYRYCNYSNGLPDKSN